MDTQKDLLSIKDCVKEYGVAISTLRRWIKKGELPASLVDTQYVIQRADLERLLIEKNLFKSESTVDTHRVSTSDNVNTQVSTHMDTQVDTLITQMDTLKRENEYLKEKISTLERTISILEKDKEFLQAQVQQLTNTLALLTTRQLPEPKGFIDRIKGWFKKE